jgi:hypothetical protein
MYQYIEETNRHAMKKTVYTHPCQEELHRLHSQEACHTDLELQD